MTRNPRKGYPRISSFMIAKENSDAKGVLVTINKNSSSSSSRKNNGEDGGGDNDNNIFLSANTRMPNVTITD